MIFIYLCLAVAANAGEYWGSRTSNKYHNPTCKWAHKIHPSNRLVFNSPEEAVIAGYIPCPVCKPPLFTKIEKETTIPAGVKTNAASPSVNPAAPKANVIQASDTKNILFVSSEDPDYPTSALFINAVKSKLQEVSKQAINYSYENINPSYSYASPEREEELVSFLKQKYQGHLPDIVVAHMAPIISKYSESIFPGVPVIYSGSETDLGEAKMSLNMMSYQKSYDLIKAFKVIMQIRPEAKKVYIVIGDAEEERIALAAIKKIVQNYESRITFVYLNNQPFSEMRETVKKLDSNSIVIYFHLYRDVEGKIFSPVKAMQHLRKESPVPVFGIGEQYIGYGSIGGYVFSRRNQGEHVAEIISTILNGKKISGIRLENISFGEYVFDWRELKRWKINESNLPSGSRIEFKQNTIWDLYKWQIAGVLIFILLETLLIVALLINYFKRKKAEAELTAAHEFQEATTEELAKLYGQQYMTSRLDKLTGLYNRRHMEEKIQEEYSRFLRSENPFSLIIGDLDFFKKVNDTYSHAAGDYLLKAVANVLQESVRACDIVSRWGGEEFLFLLPEIDLEGSKILAERIRKKIEETKYSYGDTALYPTMTFGVSTILVNDSIEDVINRSDNALFEGKRNGRNRVVSA